MWRGILIVIPVVLLTVLGLISLRQDRLLAEAQARERAQELAEELARTVESALKTEDTAAIVFEVDGQGELLFPPPIAPPGTLQPFAVGELTPDQAALWQNAQAQQWAGDIPDALAPYEAFLKLQPPSRFAAAARYSRAILFRKQGDHARASEEFASVARDFPEALSESGVPFQVLAQFNWLESTTDPSIAQSLGSNVVFEPTALSQQILKRLAQLNQSSAEPWLQRWQDHERARTLYRAARSKLGTAGVFWAFSGTNEWLFAKQREQTNSIRYSCWQEPLGSTFVEFARRLPRYFDFSLELAGKAVISSNQVLAVVQRWGGKGAGQWWETARSLIPPPVFSTASRYDNNRTEYLRAAIHLVSPQMLYERQRERARWFGLLIVATGAVAMFGYVSSLKALQKQQRLAELKSNFVSSVSHELRAPIASVRLMAEGLERGTVRDDARQQEYFRFIVQECRRLSALIENVLDFARIEQGRKQYEFEPTDLPMVLYQAASVMKPYATEKQIDLRVVANEAEFNAPVRVDAHALQQALINLIDNAIKHSPAGSTVRVGLGLGEAKRQWAGAVHDAPRTSQLDESPKVLDCASPLALFLWVEDEGTGIPSEEHQKIFERFYRCGSELRRETQGVGIGLSIVKHIAEAHGGTVTVQSEVGKGSRFTIEIPVSQQQPELQNA